MGLFCGGIRGGGLGLVVRFSGLRFLMERSVGVLFRLGLVGGDCGDWG